MTKCIIVDDEPRNVAILEKLVQQYCNGITVVGSADNVPTAIQAIRQLQPQLVFLDIEMPSGNAFDLLDQLVPVAFKVIFVTAFDNYAIKAFKYSALDYLLKPVDIDDLRVAVDKAVKQIQEPDINQRLNDFFSHTRDKYAFSKIGLRTQDGLLFYAVDDIVYCSAEGAYTRFGFMKGKSVLATGNLKKFEEMLSTDRFFRVHDTYLINLDHIKKYHNGKSGYVEMTDGTTIAISIRKRADFLRRLRY